MGMMQAYLELWGPAGPELVPLEGERITIGRAATNDVRVTTDQHVSRLHAVLEHYRSGWSVRDLGSANGTFVNGDRLLSEHRLGTGDEVRLGSTRVIFRTREHEDAERTLSAEDDPPDVTRREHDVLIALCRPVVNADSFAQPATIKQMAEELVVSEAAIKFHLANLYLKFGLYETGLSRRAQLANEAVRRGSVTIAELQRRDDRRR